MIYRQRRDHLEIVSLFFFNDTATTEIYTLSLHDALPISLFQELEYLRSFVVGKMGWSAINAMSNVSGGYGLFRRDVVMAAGGYGSDSFAEDMDMLLRIMGYCCENNVEYKVVQIQIGRASCRERV